MPSIVERIANVFNGAEIERKAPKGAAQFFVGIDDKWGVKFQKTGSYKYENGDFSAYKKRVREAFDLQRLVYEKSGLAPEAGEIVEFSLGGRVYYGYTTRRAYTFDDAMSKSDETDYFKKLETQPVIEYLEFYKSRVKEVMKEIYEKTQVFFGDMKPQNAGILDDKLVVIDFGDEGLSTPWRDKNGEIQFWYST